MIRVRSLLDRYRPPSGGQTSTVATPFLRMTLDHDTGSMTGTILRGRVTQLDSDSSRRIHSRLRGDFTPFRIPVVRFDELVLPDGASQSLVSDSTKDGVPILRLSPPPGQKKGSIVSREIAAEKQRVKDAAAQITAPGRGDRLVQFLYTQLPSLSIFNSLTRRPRPR